MNLSSAIVERVDDVFADMTMPHQPGGRAPGHRPWRAPLQQVLWPRGSETQGPITADSSFYLASISKQITAMAIMMPAEQVKLGFEDRLLAYFPRFPAWGQRSPFATTEDDWL